jgi:hypothetical protein
MRTTINIRDGLLAELRQMARQRKHPCREVLEETLQPSLGSTGKPRPKVRLITRRVGLNPLTCTTLPADLVSGSGFSAG